MHRWRTNVWPTGGSILRRPRPCREARPSCDGRQFVSPISPRLSRRLSPTARCKRFRCRFEFATSLRRTSSCVKTNSIDSLIIMKPCEIAVNTFQHPRRVPRSEVLLVLRATEPLLPRIADTSNTWRTSSAKRCSLPSITEDSPKGRSLPSATKAPVCERPVSLPFRINCVAKSGFPPVRAWRASASLISAELTSVSSGNTVYISSRPGKPSRI